MRQQVSSPEHAPVSLPKKACEKYGRREETVGNGKRTSDSLKLGDRRVLVKMPGNRLKIASSSQQGKEQNDFDHKVPETSENCVKDEEEIQGEGQKRPQSDGVNLLQWGQKKRLRFNNKVDAKAAVEETAGAKNAILRPDRRVVRAEKVLAVQIKGPVVTLCTPSAPKSASGDSRRDAEGTAAIGTTHIVNNHMNSGCENGNSDKACASPANTLAAASARAGENAYPERAALLEKVDMELFQWPKFIISLSRKEKEDDFFAIKGTKLPIRPKKRLKHIEKALHFISPGSWLCELSRERYEVREKKAIKKKPRGLKAMGSADSDTE